MELATHLKKTAPFLTLLIAEDVTKALPKLLKETLKAKAKVKKETKAKEATKR